MHLENTHFKKFFGGTEMLFRKKITFCCPSCNKETEVNPNNFWWNGGGFSACMADGKYECPSCHNSTLIYTSLGDNTKKLFPKGLPRKYRN